MHRLIGRPAITSFSHVCEMLEVDPLSKEEKDEGTLALAALLYQYWETLDARFMIAFWALGVTTPRVAQYFANWKKKQEQRRTGRTPEKALEGRAADVMQFPGKTS